MKFLCFTHSANQSEKQLSMVDEIRVTIPKANLFRKEQIKLSDVIGQGRFIVEMKFICIVHNSEYIRSPFDEKIYMRQP